MKKTYRLKNLDCANCAAKMQRAISALPEIEAATVDFFTQKMILQFSEAANETELLQKVREKIKRVEPDCEVIG